MERSPWKRELSDFARAFSGAWIFGTPLLFTMEMWWLGEYADPRILIAFLAIGLVANLGLSWVVGFKQEEHTIRAATHQAFDALAVGIVAAAVVLVVLNRIQPSDPIASIVGMIVVQAVPLSIGASVANEIFGRPGEKGREGEAGDRPLKAWQELFADIGATIIGGIFVGFSIAPTEEIQMLAAGLDTLHLVALVAFSVLAGYVIVFASGFDEPHPPGLFQRPVTETSLAYVVSLAVALVTLYLFHQIDTADPFRSIVEQTLVLGVPTTIGGAAGRLVI